MFDAMKSISDLTMLLRAARDQAKRIENLEIVGQLTDAQMQVADLKDEIIRLREQVTALEDAAKIRGELLFEQGAYYRVQVDRRDGPYCSRCWDVTAKVVRLMNNREFRVTCPECKTAFDDVISAQ